MHTNSRITLVNDEQAVKVRLVEPVTHGFLVIAAQVGRWNGPFAGASRSRSRALTRLADLCGRLSERADVVEAVTFRGVLRPPGEGSALLRRAGIRPARYDVVVLVRTAEVDDVASVRTDASYAALTRVINESASHTYEFAGENAARIADVDHGSDDRFLFNYFYCADLATVRDVWEYTAGWFQQHTALPNSTLMRPLDGEPADYSVVNHASWPALRTFLPSLLFRPSFRSFVLANFKANGVAAQPIIYRRYD